jgi:hypothetical protein
MVITVDILAMDAYSRMELCTPIYHDYGDGGVVNISRWWTHIPEWRYARQSFWVRLANHVGSKSFLIFFQNSIGHIP